MINLKLKNLKPKRFNYLDLNLLSLCNDSVWLAGGAIRSFFTNEFPNDYDFFFNNEFSFIETKEKINNLEYKLVFKCPLGNLETYIKENIKVQLITLKFYENLDEVINSFDFSVTKGGTNNDILKIGDNFFNDLKSNYLRIEKLTYPASSINRIIKYKNKGYFVNDAIQNISERIFNHDEDIINNTFLYVD